MVRMGKNPRLNKTNTKAKSVDQQLVGHVTTNLIQSIYAPMLKMEAIRQSEAYADYIVKSNQHADTNNEADDGVNVTEVKTIYKNQKMLDELDEFLSDLSKDLSSGIEWKAKARAARFERRLNERYGIFRPLLTSPTLQPYVRMIQRKYALGHFNLVRQGDGPLSLSSSMILLYMLHRNKVRMDGIVLIGLYLLIGIRPWVLVFIVSIAVWLLERRRKEPPADMSSNNELPSITPYYKCKENDEKSRRKAANECLKRPVGSPLQSLELDKESYDTILIGSGPGILYTAALLSRVGKRVVVLSPDDDASGCLILKHPPSKKWNEDIPFDSNDSKVGRISRQQKLLAPALCTDRDVLGGVRFVPIGTEADGYAYDIVTVPGMGKSPDDSFDIPFVLRAGGVNSLADDACTFLGDGWMETDSVSAAYLNSCDTLNNESSQFYMAKLLPSWSKSLDSNDGSTYSEASRRYASDFLKVMVSQNPHVKSLLAAIGLRSENLPPYKTSMGVHIANCGMACSSEGYHYVVGGPRALCHALCSTIESCGGKVYSSVKIRHLTFEKVDKGNKSIVPSCTGVQLMDESILSGHDIISGTGFLPTFLQLVPEDIRQTHGIPSGVPSLREKRPLIKLLVGIYGDSAELELPPADWWRLPACSAIQDNSGESEGSKADDEGEQNESDKDAESVKTKFDSGKSWIHIAFPSAKDPTWKERYLGITTCVVTVEADDDFVKKVDSKPVVFMPTPFGEGEVSRLIDRIMRDLYEVFPQLEGKVACHEFRGPIRSGLSHTPERYAAQGVRPETIYPGLVMSGSDLTVDGFSGTIVGSWLAANVIVGYSSVDYAILRKNITSDLENILYDPDGEEIALPLKVIVDDNRPITPEIAKAGDHQLKEE